MLVRDLAWLVALAETGHLTDTAALLGTTQPTLSRALARAEAELGTRLFERLPTGVRPNADGELVLAAARDVVARWEEAREELARRHDPDRGLVRLAFLDSIASSLVPRVLRAFHAEAPGVRVQLRQEPGHVITDDLAAGGAELAITSPHPGPGHGWVALQEERLVVVVPAAHRWRARRRLERADLARLAEAGEELVTTPVGFGYRELTDRLVAGSGLRTGFESPDLAAIEGLVAAGLGVAILPEWLAGTSGTVGIPLRSAAARRTIGLTWRLDRPLSPAADRLRALVGAPGTRW